ncbi:MAG: T9SS type A sorting domain-containing protein [Bacteroidota bacterium]
MISTERLTRTAILMVLIALPFLLKGQSAGEVMFTGFNADGNDGFSFVTFVPLPAGTEIQFSDDEWNGQAISGTGDFNDDLEGGLTWQNNTGNSISAGTMIIINNSATLTPTVNFGMVSGTIDLDDAGEVLYMFLGSDPNTPTSFISAITNNTFMASGSIDNTNLSIGGIDDDNAIQITGDNDVMVYNGSILCTSTIGICADQLSDPSNWITDEGAGSSTDADAPNFPDDVTSNFYGVAFEPVTYYSRQTGDWANPNSWTTISDGSGGPLSSGIYPSSSDNVVILAGDTITVNAVTDNNGPGISPDGLGRSNVGAGDGGMGFAASNIDMFYHTGDIVIEGTLSFPSDEAMFEGYTNVRSAGSLNLNSSFVQLGYLEIDQSATFSSLDDLILTGNSINIINTNSTTTDDLIIDHMDATLCGTGINTLQNGGGSEIEFTNSADLDQVCTSFTVDCIDGMTTCDPDFPQPGTGNFITGNSGPAGVGDLNSNQLWLKADDLSLANGANVTSWADASGNGLSATSSGSPPTFSTNSVNSILPSVNFDGTQFLSLGIPMSLDLVPGSDSISFFAVYNVPMPSAAATLMSKAVTTTPAAALQYSFGLDVTMATYRFASSIGSVGIIGSIDATDDWFLSSQLTNNMQQNSWTNGSANFAAGIGTDQASTTEVLIGASRLEAPNTGIDESLVGDLSEIVLYDAELNQAQRIIIENYLAAKYDIDISASMTDFYEGDDNDKGDFDFEVAGIGRASDGSRHLDASGPGQVRVFGPNNLEINEFLIWGHDNRPLSATASGVSGVIEERLLRTWRISETGDVGTVSISFDLSGLASPLGSNLRLLIDRDGNNVFDGIDVTPISGSVLGTTAVFSGVNLVDGDVITIGNTDASVPLPIDLLSFNARKVKNDVLVTWTTASELNNDYFTIERSANAQDWQPVSTIPGAGNSTSTINYQMTDTRPLLGTSYYRLKQTDYDGRFSYSHIVKVVMEADITVNPNPSNGLFHIKSKSDDQRQYQLFDLQGRVMNAPVIRNELGTSIDASALPNGIYLLRIDGSSESQTFRLMKNN